MKYLLQNGRCLSTFFDVFHAGKATSSFYERVERVTVFKCHIKILKIQDLLNPRSDLHVQDRQEWSLDPDMIREDFSYLPLQSFYGPQLTINCGHFRHLLCKLPAQSLQIHSSVILRFQNK